MKAKDIKPIPKRILAKIRDFDLTHHPAQDGHNRFYAYLTTCKKELVKITVACKNYRKKWYCKQVAVHAIHTAICYVRDIEYNYFGGMGFRVGWYAQGIQSSPRVADSYDWGWANTKYYDPYAPVVNKEFVGRFPEYKYSAYELFKGRDIIHYLRTYEKFPQSEYMLKLGLDSYAESVTILRQIGKDKAFCKFLIRNKDKLKHGYYYADTIIMAYKQNRDFREIQNFLERKKQFNREKDYAPIRAVFKGKRLERFFAYIVKQKISYALYNDYLKACNYLHLDMTEDKNAFPHDFMRWHDIRIDEYHSQQVKDDAVLRKDFYAVFGKVAEKYLSLQREYGGFVIIIAKSPAELIHEGNILHHCVGRMGYDEKMAKERSLIFFVRHAEETEKPFVTVEYSPAKKSVLQCYGEHDTRPSEDVLHFVNNVWLPYANKKIKQIAA